MMYRESIYEKIKLLAPNDAKYALDYIERLSKSSYPSAPREIFSRIKVKRGMLLLIETSALFLEKGIPQLLQAKDTPNDIWFKRQMHLSANALREKKKWVLTPKEDTYQKLAANIILTITHIATDNWDALEHMDQTREIQQATKRQKLIEEAFKFVRTTPLSILPVLGFIGWQLTPYAIKGNTHDFIVFGLLLWAGITFLVKYDPDTSSKISLLKDTKDLLTIK